MTDRTPTHIITDNRFSITPHWVLFSGISGGAIQLYAVLGKYADGNTLEAFPSRTTLARDMGKSSARTIDRYIQELKSIEALKVIKRKRKGTNQNYTNMYVLVRNNPNAVEVPDIVEVEDDELDPVQNIAPGGATDCSENKTHSTTPTTSLRDHPSGDPESSLRSPSPSGRCATPDDLKPLVKAIAAATTADDHEKASYAFLEAFQDLYGTEPGYWDSGWVERLDSLVREHGTDYGCAKWLGIITNTTKAA